MIDRRSVLAPSWMSSEDRAEFVRIVAARSAMGLVVEPAEADAVADYVTTRGRLRSLQTLEAAATDTAERLRIGRAVEAALGTSRRLARDLRLVRP